MQIALAVHTAVLNARNFYNPQVGFVGTQVDERLDLETLTVNLDVLKAVSPKSVIAIAQIAEPGPEKRIHQFAQSRVTQSPQKAKIMATPAYKTT